MSKLLQTYSILIIQIMLVLGFLLVIRGHNYPGGGFIGGLIASGANALYILATTERNFWLYRVPKLFNMVGLILLLCSLLAGPLMGLAPLQGLWFINTILFLKIKAGSPLIFDFGIYCIVMGSVTRLLIDLED